MWWLKAQAYGCPNALGMLVFEEDKLHVKPDSRNPHSKQIFAIQQCIHPTSVALVCWCLCVSLGLRGGRRFPVIPFMQPKSKPEQLIWREAHPCNPSFLFCVLSRATWAGSCLECLHDVTSYPQGSLVNRAYLPPGLKSPFPWTWEHPPPFWLHSCSHALEFPPAVCSQERGCYVAILCAACN